MHVSTVGAPPHVSSQVLDLPKTGPLPAVPQDMRHLERGPNDAPQPATAPSRERAIEARSTASKLLFDQKLSVQTRPMSPDLQADFVQDAEGAVSPRGEPPAVHRAAEVLHHPAGAPRYPSAVVAEHLIRHPDRPVELTLRPEELGRVKMVLNTADGSISVVVTTERAETLDLMRRHIDLLALEFRRLGFDNIGFEFRQSGTGGRHQDQPGTHGRRLQQSDAETAPAPQQSNRTATSGLDIRI